MTMKPQPEGMRRVRRAGKDPDEYDIYEGKDHVGFTQRSVKPRGWRGFPDGIPLPGGDLPPVHSTHGIAMSYIHDQRAGLAQAVAEEPPGAPPPPQPEAPAEQSPPNLDPAPLAVEEERIEVIAVQDAADPVAPEDEAAAEVLELVLGTAEEQPFGSETEPGAADPEPVPPAPEQELATTGSGDTAIPPADEDVVLDAPLGEPAPADPEARELPYWPEVDGPEPPPAAPAGEFVDPFAEVPFTEDEAAAANADAGLDDHGDPLPEPVPDLSEFPFA